MHKSTPKTESVPSQSQAPSDKSQTGLVMELTGINKYFRVGDQDIHILKDVEVTIKAGEFCIIFGPSGSGKSTLLHTLLGLEPPTTGEVKLMSEDMAKMTADEAASFRTTRIGMIYQQPNFKVRTGDFRSRIEAAGFLHKINPHFTNAFIVPDEVKLPDL